MNTPEEEYITYVVVEQQDKNSTPNQKKVKIMNTPDEEHITYIAVEPAKAGAIQGMNKPQLSSSDMGGSANLEKVRDLLFGNQVRDFDKRFNRLEERLSKECVNLREDTKKRLDSLETYFKQEVESLTDGLRGEQSTRDESLKELAQNLQDTTKTLEKKIAQLDEQTNQKQREIRQQILDQSKRLDDEIRQKYETLLSVVERETQELRIDKTDRSTLSALFTQLAMQLNSEFEMPRNE